jgi:hypothetical protein
MLRIRAAVVALVATALLLGYLALGMIGEIRGGPEGQATSLSRGTSFQSRSSS